MCPTVWEHNKKNPPPTTTTKKSWSLTFLLKLHVTIQVSFISYIEVLSHVVRMAVSLTVWGGDGNRINWDHQFGAVDFSPENSEKWREWVTTVQVFSTVLVFWRTIKNCKWNLWSEAVSGISSDWPLSPAIKIAACSPERKMSNIEYSNGTSTWGTFLSLCKDKLSSILWFVLEK